jgi:hypothetical protein
VRQHERERRLVHRRVDPQHVVFLDLGVVDAMAVPRELFNTAYERE